MWRKGWLSEHGDHVGASKATERAAPTTLPILTPGLSLLEALCNPCGLLYSRGWFCNWVRPRRAAGLDTRYRASRRRRLTSNLMVCMCLVLCHFWPLCLQCHGVYRRIDKGDPKTTEYWLPCDYCPNWVHLQCEKEHAPVRAWGQWPSPHTI